MNKHFLKIAPVVLLALAACNKSETPADGTAEADAKAAATAAAAPAELPPSVVASDVYRCKDNTVLHVDFLGREGKDGKKIAADIRVGSQSAAATRVDAPAPEAPAADAAATPAPAAADARPAAPMKSADGETTLAGEGAQINVKLPGKGAQTCKG